MRLIAMESCVSLKKISTGNIEGIEREKVAHAIRKVGDAPIFIDDNAGLKLMDIVTKSTKLKAKYRKGN